MIPRTTTKGLIKICGETLTSHSWHQIPVDFQHNRHRYRFLFRACFAKTARLAVQPQAAKLKGAAHFGLQCALISRTIKDRRPDETKSKSFSLLEPSRLPLQEPCYGSRIQDSRSAQPLLYCTAKLGCKHFNYGGATCTPPLVWFHLMRICFSSLGLVQYVSQMYSRSSPCCPVLLLIAALLLPVLTYVSLPAPPPTPGFPFQHVQAQTLPFHRRWL